MIRRFILLIAVRCAPHRSGVQAMEGIRMRRLLVAAGAVLLFTAPAFAQSSVTVEKKTTITKEEPTVGSTVSTTIIAPSPPPAPRVEAPPPPPGPRMVWVPGHWSWERDKATYVWMGGKYMEPPREHAAWVPGRWSQRSEGWTWQEGRWD